MKFRAKNMKKFKFTVTDFSGNKREVFADNYAEMINGYGVNSIKSSVRMRA